MTIEKNKMVSVTYELKLGNKDGEVVEVSSKENPLTFPYGAGMLLPLFESALSEKEIGDNFEIEISAKDGYGLVDEYMVVNIPVKAFEIDGVVDNDIVSIGNTLPMMSTSGHVMNGLILSIENDEVIMDFNHPLAGQDLFFTGQILDIRDATDEDLKNCCDGEGCEGCGDECKHEH